MFTKNGDLITLNAKQIIHLTKRKSGINNFVVLLFECIWFPVFGRRSSPSNNALVITSEAAATSQCAFLFCVC